MAATPCSTNHRRLQIYLQVLRGSRMLMHKSQVWCLFWLVKSVKINTRGNPLVLHITSCMQIWGNGSQSSVAMHWNFLCFHKLEKLERNSSVTHHWTSGTVRRWLNYIVICFALSLKCDVGTFCALRKLYMQNYRKHSGTKPIQVATV